MTFVTQPILKAAQKAIATGHTDEAYRLLRRCARENPSDYLPWLWLAGLAKTKQQSLAYLDQAEKLKPGDPTIRKARLWARQRFGADEKAVPTAAPTAVAATAVAATATRSKAPPRQGSRARKRRASSSRPTAETRSAPIRRRAWVVAGALFLIAAFILGSAALLLSNRIFPRIVLAAPPATEQAAPELLMVAEVPEEEVVSAVQPTTAIDSASPTPASMSAMPTPTLQPTYTPAPTATSVPTVIVNTGGENVLETVTVAEGERWVDVNLTSQSLTVYEGGDPVFSTLVSSGLSEHPTVTGQFRVWMRYESQTMNGYLLGYDYYLEDVPFVMYFYNDYALHGAYWHNNFGTPMSHGCVNLAPSDAEWIFNFTSLGTLVNVHY